MKSNIENRINKKLDLILKILADKEDVISFKDACHYLNVSKYTLYKLNSNGDISHYKSAGNKIYYVKSQLNEWAKKRKVLKKCQIDK